MKRILTHYHCLATEILTSIFFSSNHLTSPAEKAARGTNGAFCCPSACVRAGRCLWLFVSFAAIDSRSNAENMPFQCLDQLIWKTSVFDFFLFPIDDRPYVETPY